MHLAGVILPSGVVDPTGSRFVNHDVRLVEIDHTLAEASEDGISSPSQLDHYLLCRKNGCGRKLAAVLATKSFPGVKSDAIFNEGRFSSDAGKNGKEQLWLKAQAEAAGVSTNGMFYCKGLASFPGDPTAWVGDRSDVLRVAREKNMTVQGYVEHKGHEVDPGEDVAIADDIIESEVQEILAECPEANYDAVREEVYAVRTGAVDNNPLCVE